MSPEKLNKAAQLVEGLRSEMMFGELGDTVNASGNAETTQLFLLALTALEQAQRYLVLAALRTAP